MANKKISELTQIGVANLTDTDQLVVVDVESSATRRMSVSNLKAHITGGSELNGVQSNLHASLTEFNLIYMRLLLMLTLLFLQVLVLAMLVQFRAIFTLLLQQLIQILIQYKTMLLLYSLSLLLLAPMLTQLLVVEAVVLTMYKLIFTLLLQQLIQILIQYRTM